MAPMAAEVMLPVSATEGASKSMTVMATGGGSGGHPHAPGSSATPSPTHKSPASSTTSSQEDVNRVTPDGEDGRHHEVAVPSTTCDPELTCEIEEVRRLFLEDLDLHPELYADFDVNKIKTSDWYVTRFLLRKHRDIHEAAKMMIACMRWRHEFEIPYMTNQHFPAEFYQIGAIFAYEQDHWGNRVIFLRIAVHRKIAELQEFIKKFVIHIMNRTDVETDGRGMAILFDCSGAGIQNADMDFLWFLISTLRNYYPDGMAYVLVYELPWLLKSCWSMAKGWIPEDDRKLIKFASKKEVTQYIPRDRLPDYMGGTCELDYRTVPEGCPAAEEAADKYGFSAKDLRKLKSQFADHFQTSKS